MIVTNTLVFKILTYLKPKMCLVPPPGLNLQVNFYRLSFRLIFQEGSVRLYKSIFVWEYILIYENGSQLLRFSKVIESLLFSIICT